MMIFSCVRYCTLLEVRDYWRNKTDGHANYIKVVAVQGSLCAPTPLKLILNVLESDYKHSPRGT
jgi:hypothetical protein